MEKLKVVGIWIPIEILLDEQLSDKEKMIYSIIICLSIEKGYCYAGNRYLSNILGITQGRVSKLISSLKEKGFINVEIIYEENSKKIKERRISTMVKNNYGYGQKELYPMVKKNQDIINNIKYYINNKRNYQNFDQRQYSNDFFEKLYANSNDIKDN